MNLFLICWWLLWLCFIIFHDRSKNEEVLAYLTYSNNDRKQKKTLSSDERIFSICNCYGCACIIFHDRMKNGEVLTYLTCNNNNRTLNKHFHLTEHVSAISAIDMAVLHNIPWQKEKRRSVSISYIQQVKIAYKKKKFHLLNVFFLSAIVMAAIQHIPWQKEKNGEVLIISYLQQ